MTGRKPIPTRLKLLRGNPGKQRLNIYEPKRAAMGSADMRAACPFTGPDADARLTKWWGYYADIFGPSQIVTATDLPVLALLCRATADRVHLEDILRKSGPLVRDDKGLFRVSPVYTIAAKERALELRLLCEFGASPSSRARIAAAPSDAIEDSWTRLTAS